MFRSQPLEYAICCNKELSNIQTAPKRCFWLDATYISTLGAPSFSISSRTALISSSSSALTAPLIKLSMSTAKHLSFLRRFSMPALYKSSSVASHISISPFGMIRAPFPSPGSMSISR